MKGWIILLALAGACGAGDDTTDGTRALCGAGGTLTDCPDSARTAQAACWRLVDCGAIPLHIDPPNGAYDWGRCVNDLGSLQADAERLVVNCIAASSCDALKVPGSPHRPDRSDMYCMRLGGLN